SRTPPPRTRELSDYCNYLTFDASIPKINELKLAALAALNQSCTWKIDDIDMLAKFKEFKEKPQSRFSLVLDGIADVTPVGIRSRCFEIPITGTKERKNHGRDLSLEIEEQASMADGVAYFEDHQIYIAEASLIHEPKLDKEVKDKFKVVRCLRDTWNSHIRSIAREAVPPAGLTVFGSTSFEDETKFYAMDFAGTYRLRQVGRMLVPSRKSHFVRRMESCVRTCLKFALDLEEETIRRSHLDSTEDDLRAACPADTLAHALKAPADTLTLKALSPEVSTQTTLVPQGTARPVKITGVVAIARFLARSFPTAALYNESDPASVFAQDALLDTVRHTIFTPKHLAALAAAANHSDSFLSAKEQPTLADYAVWGTITAYTKSHSLLSSLKELPKFMAWMGRMDQREECKKAIAELDDVIQKATAALAAEAAAAAAEKAKQSSIIRIPTIKGSDPSVDPIDAFKNVLAAQLASLLEVDIKILYDALESPRDADNGHIALAVPRLRLKGNPSAIAADIVSKFQLNDYVLKAKADGPFVNFFLNHIKLAQSLFKKIYETKERWGCNHLGENKKVIVEFSSPNIAKPFHAGHLRSTIIGSFVRNILDANGYDTVSMNYLGDWGKQYGLLAVGFERYGSEEKLLEDPIKHLFDVYVKVNADAKENEAVHDEARAYFKKMEDGDEAALKIWSRFRDLSIVKYKEIYARLNIAFDVYSGESQVTDGMERALKMLHEKKLLTESDGALIVDLTAYKLGICVVQKKDGTTLYITRDIGAALERYEKYGFEHMYYIVASQQDLHLKQLFKILELLGFDWAKKVTHLNFGMVGGMSTRKGTVVFLEDILEETRDSMHEVMKKNEHKYAQIEDPLQVADNIGISAIMIQDASARRVKNYDFDWNRMFSFEGDTGPYLQYAHARLCSIERKTEMEVNPNADLTQLGDSRAAGDLITMIARYPQIVRDTSRSFEPVNIVGYAMKLSHNVSQALESMYVMGAAKEVAEARLFMYWCARVTLGNAMRLLNLKPQDRM
ncbi:hypothetical protein BGZ94_002270, partial [Podila epigama]